MRFRAAFCLHILFLINGATIKNELRCGTNGDSDSSESTALSRHLHPTYKFLPSLIAPEFNKSQISWKISNYPIEELDDRETVRASVVDAVNDAFQLWSSACDLNFFQTDSQTPDINLMFQRRKRHNRECAENFDFLVFAHYVGMSQNPRSIHINDDVEWTIRRSDSTNDAVNLIFLLAHEIGHALGFAHNNLTDSIMFKHYYHYHSGVTVELSPDDIAAAQKRYGRKQFRPEVPRYWFAENGSSAVNYTTARERCASEGGHLPHFNTSAQHDDFLEWMRGGNYNTIWLDYYNDQPHSVSSPGIWHAGGSEKTFVPQFTPRWKDNEPNNHEGDQYCVRRYSSGYIDDTSCSADSNEVVCQKDTDTKTKTSAAVERQCNKTVILTLSNPTARLTSQQYPGDYPNNQRCTETIKAPAGYPIVVNFTSFLLAPTTGCAWDYLQIDDRPITADVKKYCGDASPPTFQSSTPNVYIFIYSDGSYQGSGYDLTVEAVKAKYWIAAGNRSRVNYTTARQLCASEGGHLPHFNTEAEHTDFLLWMRNGYDYIWLDYYNDQPHSADSPGIWYAGGNDKSFVPKFTRWRTQEPNNNGGGQNCVYETPSGFWDDITCSDNYVTTVACMRPFPRYWFFSKGLFQVDYAKAHQLCASEGGHLPHFNTEVEYNEFNEWRKRYGHLYWIWLDYYNDQPHNVSSPGIWYAGGSRKTFVPQFTPRWGKNQPRQHYGNEFCAFHSTDGYMYNSKCSSDIATVCQREVNI